MEPSLAPGTGIICRTVVTRPVRGSIVVFRHPKGLDMWLVKRVIGLPHEEVVVDFGEVLIDGRSGVDLWSGDKTTFPEGKWKLGADEVLVLSDNRAATVDDSRTFGPVPIRGLLRVIWPRMKPLSNKASP
jgi:signal peptidase I